MQPPAPARIPVQPHDGVPRSVARLLGWGGILLAAVLPAVVWRRPIAAIAEGFEWTPGYFLTGWLGYGMLAAGLLFMLPVVISIGRHPDSRLYPRNRNALSGWGISLYLLGCGIAVQVAQIAAGPGES